MNGRDDTPRIHIAHRLLRARDWQDRPQFGHLCDWWRGGSGGVCALVGIGGAGKTAIEGLSAEACVALLRQRGVKGSTNSELRAIARDQGCHALSVDLIGGYVVLFCGSDPSRLPPEPRVPQDVENDTALDPRIAAIREQERRFARLAERYAEALRESDPAALALLQRVCLFRLGVDASTLASIFTGEGKEAVAGPGLARLHATGLEAKLALLAEMKLLERDEDERYSAHPAVRDGFLKSLDVETSLRGHEGARERLTALLPADLRRGLVYTKFMRLVGGPGAEYPSNLATLDLLEEIVHHTLAAGHVQGAWEVYWDRIGEYKNLGWRLGAYERGERICRAFAGGHAPQDAPLPEGLSEHSQAAFVNEWALYLQALGALVPGARCYECQIELRMRQRSWANAARGNLNLLGVLFLSGRLATASEATEEALRLADRADDDELRCYSYASRAHVRAQRGDTPGALADFRSALHWQHEAEGDDDPLYSSGGFWHTLLLSRLGQNEEATRLTAANDRICIDVIGERYHLKPIVYLALADLACKRHDLNDASQFLDAAHEWAIARDAKEPLCSSALVRARMGRGMEERELASRAVEDGLRIARDCGYGIHHIDLLLLRARLALEEGNVDEVIADIDTALFEGVHPPEDSGLPELLAATDPECGYAWGEAEGRQLRGEALLTRAARRLGRGDFAPARFAELPIDVRGLIDEAREELEVCRRLQERIQDPKVAETADTLAQLGGGVLTRHPLRLTVSEATTTALSAEKSVSGERKRAAAKKHVFLSYVRESFDDVERLREDLIQSGETVWWDRDIPPGANWRLEIRKALKDAYAFVLCLSKDMEARESSGAFPEIRDAIAIYRELAPGRTFIFPVRLSECEVPSFEIDATTTLENLQPVDLFPAAKRPDALSRLVAALKALTGHPRAGGQ